MQVFEDEIARRCGNFETQALTNMLVRPTPELNEAACGASSHQARGDVVISGNGVMQPVVFSSWRVTWVCDAVCGLTVSTIAKTGGFCMRLSLICTRRRNASCGVSVRRVDQAGRGASCRTALAGLLSGALCLMRQPVVWPRARISGVSERRASAQII